ncbi:hypothetical protein [Streptomyces nodosus]|uniref:Uncharacterized protein n=1 Tax=Streptomyces nodosus TaxID=40318 RepID=A0A0B5DH10_9ACTN|nr:hypothetical protein [Streptomyces nodosus]AJE40455.1 hypothetical protein SNOD_10680 [Streptomyces nodosus]MBB4791497.1 hypothetical protein [Streptomyces nodosus]QEV39019.1 hypothetical protein CP978_11005 [Streptomyces nodosus]
MDAGDYLAQQIEAMRQMLADTEPVSLRTSYLADPSAGNPVLQGSTATALVPRWNERSSGLWVPASFQEPAPIDLTAVYLTPEEIFGFQLPADYIRRQLQRLPLEGVLRFCALALNALAVPGASVSEVDQQFADRLFKEPIRGRVLNLLRDETRRLLVPQAFMLLARMAMEASPDTLPEGTCQGDVLGAFFAVVQTTGVLPDSGPTIIGDRPGTLGREIIANQHFNHNWSVAGFLARYARRWLQLPAEHRGEPGIVDLGEVYRDCTGIQFESLAAVAGYLWMVTASGRFVIELGELTVLDIPSEQVEAVLALISTDLSGMREAVRSQQPDQRTEWAFDPFQQWPVLRLPEGRLLVLDPRHLLNRAFGWLPIWDIKFPPPGHTRPVGHRKLAARAESTLRHLSEVYVSEVLHRIVGDEGTTRRVYDDAELKAAYTAEGQRIADAAIDYPGTWIVIEVTTSQLRREAATAVPGESQIEDIDKLIEELDQIDATIAALRRDEAALTGTSAPAERRYLPLLVLPEGFPVNPVTLTVIRERARARGLLQAPDTDPVEIVDIEELEMIEGIQEESGPGMLDILRGKQSGGLRIAAVRDHIFHVMRLHPRRPARQSELLDAALKPLADALPRPPHGGTVTDHNRPRG